MSLVKFKVKQFSSGEYDVQIDGRIYGDNATIHYNWFKKEERDMFLLLLKIDTVRRNYPNLSITLDAPYLPYMRQDRLFDIGGTVPATVLTELLHQKVDKINTYACHSVQPLVNSNTLAIYNDANIVYPDINARHHYANNGVHYPRLNVIIFDKVRDSNGVTLVLNDVSRADNVDTNKQFIIFDDLVAGGRTFIECANELRDRYGDDINIELTVYHAFLDFGLDALKASGIKKINIINLDSFEYILRLYPQDVNYFEYIDLKGE